MKNCRHHDEKEKGPKKLGVMKKLLRHSNFAGTEKLALLFFIHPHTSDGCLIVLVGVSKFLLAKFRPEKNPSSFLWIIGAHVSGIPTSAGFVGSAEFK